MSFSMADSHGPGHHELSSSSLIQSSQVSHAYTPGETSESKISHKPETNLAISLNDQNRNKPWKPLTLRAPTIVAYLLTTVALIALIEYINKISIEKKALFFPDEAGDFPVGVVFCYQYLPQMIVVALGVGWAAVDLDVKRLEPYFRLSKPEGATASNSIFLHYPFEFIAFVPINAARRGHWNVFWAGLALCLIFWGIAPFNSSLLTTHPVTRDIETPFKSLKSLIPFQNQTEAMSASFLYTSYSVTWLGEKVHPFLTKELIAIPFKPASYGKDREYLPQGNESWTALTRVYQTELSCTPAEIKAVNETTYKFSTNRCTHVGAPLPDLHTPYHTQNMMYIGFGNYQSGRSFFFLNKEECRDPNLFLAIWAKSLDARNRSDLLDLNALYCKPSYHYQTHEVTVDGTSGSIMKAEPVGRRTNFTQEDKVIDIIRFEGNVGDAATVPGVNPGYFSAFAPNGEIKLADWHLVYPRNQISYVRGLSPGNKFDDYRDPMTFRNGLDRMHKLLFNNALETLLVDDSDGEEVVGKRVVTNTGIVVVPLIAHILAGTLGLVVVCLGGVFLVSNDRQNNLASDPDTLGTKMALVAHSEMLLRDFNGTDECSAPDLCMEPRKYKLGTWGGGGEYRLDVVGGRDNPLVRTPHASCTVPHSGKLVSPVELSIWIGLAATLVNSALLTLLVVLYKSSLRWNGLPTLSDTQFVSQIIFSFFPTAIATLLEPFWVLVGRYHALFQPYIELRRGNASPASSLGLKYTNIPPVLIAPRALRHGHIFLFLASMMVITANILAVALGGIFDQSSQPLTSNIIVTYHSTTSIYTGTRTVDLLGEALKTFAKDKQEPWLVLNTNVIEGTDLPPWVTDEFYFLPFEWGSREKTGLRTSMTQGYGGNLTCQLLAGNTYQQISHMRGRTGEIGVVMPVSGGDFVRCRDIFEMDPQLLKSGTHPFAVEWVHDLEASNPNDKKAVRGCRGLILAAWGRGEVNQRKTASETAIDIQVDIDMQSNTTIICSQQISTGVFRVTVDGEGRVKRSKLIGELKYDDPEIFNPSASVRNFTAQLAMLLRAPPRQIFNPGIMHNDNASHSFSLFIGEYLIKKTLSDPATPSPSFEDAQQALSKFYKRFFTILLAQNRNTIFFPAGNMSRSEVGQFESIQPRMSMDPVMFYIAVAILGFQLLAGTIIFALTPRRLLPRFPYNLASEISFFYASSALSDVSGTANMTSAMRRRHLKRLGGTYGYGKFRGSDGENHVGIERMSMIRGYKEAVVTTSSSSLIPETTMVRTAAAVTSANSSPPQGGEDSVEGGGFCGRGSSRAGFGGGSDWDPGRERG
ncbi:hypothetical protein B9Z19DRAFT_1129183 [Tuber borchii]|uniref:Uncharacterized protein n=1 Tax=Tuber borchii TaxID=42251 RepID=A0A2T6ZMT4_TUBBO|nr:hypothetical protein B9Z19DRAFT_1129183 [Tuber borchii]